MSFAQQRLWFLYKLEGANGFYNIPLALRISGEINTNALIQSIEAVVARHEALRTRFVEVDGVATQVIDGVDGFKVIQEEISEQALQSVCKSEASAPFDLSVDRLLRAHFFNVLESEDHVLLVTMHHIVSDGWSMEVFYREVVDFYQAFCQGASPSLAELPIQYADFAHWQRQWLGEEVLQIQRDYWQQQLSGLAPLLTFPTDHPRPPVKSYRGANEPVHFSVELLDQLKALGERQGVTLYMTLLSGFSVLLGRYTGQEDIPIGSPVANRNRPEVENLIGFFVNTLVMRTDLSGDQSFTEILAQVKETALGAYAHQDIPFEHLVEVLNPERSMNYTPLFQVMFALQSTQADEHVDIGDLSFSPLKSGSGVAKFDLTLTVRESASGLLGSVEYDSDLFEAETIRRFIEHYQRLLKAIVAEPEAKISEYEILSEAERHQQLIEWNDTQTDYPQGKCIHELFEEQAEQHPDNIALIFEDEELTYKALNERANQVAHYLIAQGVKPDTLVGLCVERSLEMVIGLIGILKAGGAYVPIDPDYPEERIRYMLEDSGVNILLSQSYLCERLPVSTQRVVYLDSDEDGEGQAGIISSQSSENIPKDRIALNSQHLAYVIYTSGSTGRPKGVMIEHEGVVDYCSYGISNYYPGNLDGSSIISAISFDATVTNLYFPLLVGDSVELMPEKIDLINFWQRIESHAKSLLLKITPSHIQALPQAKKNDVVSQCHHTFVIGGELLSFQNYHRLKARFPSSKFYHHYGPTETIVGSTILNITSYVDIYGRGVPIGKPMANTTLYVVDASENISGLGVPGELYIGGVGLARGYLNNPELTAEKFIANPFSDDPDERLYRTGDLVRWLPDGNLEFIGRIDDQVKIRGFRIELGEIESQLQMHESVRSCVVVVREDIEGDKRLVAYVVIDSLSEVEDHVRVLREHLQQQLPEYMLPSAFVVLDELPLTSNGKIDRKSLPAPEGDAYAQEEYVAPETETEEVLVGIWSDLLGLEAGEISTRANFFALGGHSLLVVQLISRLQQLNLFSDVRSVFSVATLGELASVIDGQAERAAPFVAPVNMIPEGCKQIRPSMLPLIDLTEQEIAQVVQSVPGGVSNIQDIYPLAPLQEGIFFHHLMEQSHDPYILSALFNVRSNAQLDSFLEALQWVITRHDVLRTAVLTENLPVPVQVVYRAATLEVGQLSVPGGLSEEQVQDHLQSLIRGPQSMDLTRAPLLDVQVAHHEETQSCYMLLRWHHLISDHEGFEIIGTEVPAYLANQVEQLPAPMPYREFVAHALHQAQTLDAQAYFQQRLGDVTEPTLPFDLRDVHGDGSGIEEARQELSRELSLAIRATARDLQMTPAVLFHAAWSLVVAACSGREDVVFGTVLSGRLQGTAGADRMLGMFINTLPLKVSLAQRSVVELVKEIEEGLRELLVYEQASLSLAQRCSGLVDGSLLFSALLNYRHSASVDVGEGLEQADFGIRALAVQERTNYPFAVSVNDLGEGFSIDAQVDRSVSVRRVIAYLEIAITGLVEALQSSPEMQVLELSVLPEAERHQQLIEWNDTQTDYPQDKCIHELFEEQAEQHPDNIALIFEDEELTYKALNERANQVAHYLIAQGVKPDTLVGLCVERSLEMVIGLIGILKAGGAYVPIDPDYPEERIRYMLEDSGVNILLSQSYLCERLPVSTQRVVYLDSDEDGEGQAGIISSQSSENIPKDRIALNSQHLAYVIYTSGSTGQPKGVMIEHASVVADIIGKVIDYGIDINDRGLAITSLSFDPSVTQIFMPLVCGSTVVISKNIQNDFLKLLAWIDKAQITFLNIVPQFLEALLIDNKANGLLNNSKIRIVTCGGDVFPPSLLEKLSRKILSGVSIFNNYGPTEATITSTKYLFPEDISTNTKVLIGRPNQNTSVYILDNFQKIQAVGVVGEMYIGGAGLARGYLNNPELTAEKFIANPFSDDPDERLYRTGDLVRWLPDGNLEFIGRIDDQVKIRGFRIELGEIESQLQMHESVRSCVVVVREDIEGDKRLVAYVVIDSLSEVEDHVRVLREHLQQQLPEYMLPSAFVVLDELPLTSNGKIDRKSLPAPEGDAYAQEEYVAPETETEEVLVGIWSDLLGLEAGEISTRANFFALGGHSLLVVQLISRLQQLNLFSDVRSVFSVATLGELASVIDGQAERAAPFVAPVNMIPEGCKQIRPSMLPLIDLTEQEIAQVVQSVPGGVSNIQDIYPLAPLQEGIFFHHLMEQSHDPYILSALFNVRSNAQLDSFLEALQWVITRHDVLRTAVLTENLPVPVQVVYRAATLEVGQLSVPGGLSEEQVQDHLQSLIRGPQSMDLTRAPLLDVQVAHHEETQSCYMLLRWHHLISDHEGFEIIGTEVPAYLANQVEQLPAPMPYREFVAHALHQAQTLDAQAYFQQRLGDVTEPTLPFDLRDVHGDGSGIEEARQELSRELSLAIRATARDLQMTPAVLFHAAWSLVVAACSGREDVVFGTVLSGRLQGTAGADRMLGMFINTLPLKVSLAQRSVVELVKEIEEGLRELLVYEQASLSLAQRCSGLVDGSLLFSALLNYRHSASVDVGEGLEQADFGIRALAVQERTNYPFAVSVNDLGEGFSIDAQVDRSVSVRRVIAYLEIAITGLVEALQSSPEMQVLELSVLPEAERHQQLIEWNDTQTDYPQDKCIHELFEEQAEQHPDNIALIFEDEELTYKALNERANQVAHYLIAQGVKPDTLVGLCVERSLEMVIGLIGILKAGGAYVPIDPDYPEERIRYMLEDSGVNILLSQSYLCERLPVSTQRVVYLDSDEDGEGQAGIISSQSSENIPKDRIALNSQHLAYVIYTSGSTGRPKGVMIEHASLFNHIFWRKRYFSPSNKDIFLQKTSLTFDMSVSEITVPLSIGGVLVIAKQEAAKDIPYLLELIFKTKITALSFVPSILQEIIKFPEKLLSVQKFSCGGEALQKETLSKFLSDYRECNLYNLYGPTELTIAISIKKCDSVPSGGNISIGSPIANTQFYVLDGDLKLVPQGVAGELLVGGASLARKYLNQDDLTREKFIHNPYSTDKESRLYRTGDLVRWLPDGNLEFIGRIDDQVKIRGFRIELGEIESQLQMHESVRSCVVVVREDIEGDKRLVAYVVIDSLSEVEDHVRVLREHLQQQLPEYMLPSAFVVLDELPLTSNGKIDRKSLPAPEGDAYAQEEYVAPETETEEVLVGIWSDLLGLEAGEISTRANFFALGGHSLLATRLVNLIFQRTGKELSLRSVFESPNVDKLAFLIDQLQTATEVLPLTRCNREQAIPLSFAQQRLWFLYKLEGANGFYNIPLALRISGEINTNALIQSIEAVVARHEALRTRFVEVDGVATQVIDGVDGFKVIQEEISEQALQSVCKSEASAPFDLSVDRLLRAHFFNVLESEDHVLLVTMHHIVSDGWSMEVFYREVVDFYQAFCQGASPSLAELPIQYADFAHWQRQWLGEEVLQIQRDYWQQQLSGLAPLLTFPTDHPRPPVKSYRGANEPVHFSVELLDQLKALGERQGVTLYMTLLSGFSVLLGRYTGQEDIPIGSPVANRNRPEVENLIGFFVNTLVMRTDLSGDQSFTEILAQVKETALGAYAHQDIPFEHLVEVLNPERSMNYTPLFQVMFALQSTQADEHVDIGDLSFSPLKSGSGVAKFDLTLTVRESASGLLGSVEYDSDLFEAETIRRFIEHYQRLLKAIVAEPEAKISEYEILSEAERHQQLIEWNDTQTDYPQDKCIHELFEEQAEQHPDNIALIFEDEELTYKALNERANQVAHYLIAQGVKPDTLVGLCVERSLEMVIGLIGILKAGGAYVPIDPDYPEERIRYMLEDSGVNILLSQSYLCERLPVSTQRVVYLDSDEDGEGQAGIISSQSSENIPKDRIALNSQHLAYVIYTSGSTGRPKGVMIEHEGVVDYCSYGISNYYPGNLDGSSIISAISFDATVTNLYFPLLVGDSVELMPEKIDLINFWQRIESHAKSLLLKITPSHIQALPQAKKNDVVSQCHHTFVIGGELLSFQNYHRLKARFPSSKFYHHYGPTETIVGSTILNITSYVDIYGRGVPIGKPMANTTLYVVDASENISGLGVPGELYIGGVGLARGYLNNPELTAEKFIANPFSDDPDERLYRTGDLVRWLPDGNLEFIGRIDDQVKIRGFRIELGEIESQLQMHESVRSCVVVVREDIEGDKRLVAYVVIDSLSEVEDHVRVLREHLQQQLPEYMLPSAFVVLDELPLTSNGKIDRKSLPAPEGDAYAQEEYVAPETETEEVLVGIWSDLLGLEAGEISTRANFFALGGHSLLATRLVNLIFQRTGKELSLRSVFESPNVDKLAFLIDQLQTATEVLPLTRCNREQAIPLSFAQQRLWFLYKLEGANGFYNIPLALRISGEINTNALIQSIEAVVARHEALRTRFVEVDGVATQVIDGVDGFKVIQEEISEQALQSVCKSEASAPFDLSVDRLLRAHFFNVLESEDHVLLVTMHHIVSDGWSMEVFYREVVDFYQAFCQGASPSLAELPIQYADFAHWQRQWLGEEVLQIQRDYWQQQLSGLAPLLTFPTDHPRPPVKSYRGANEPVHFSVELLDQLKALGERQGVTLYMTLLSGFSVLLGRYTGQEDIPIGSPVANRNRPEVENLIGFFVNTLVMRTDLSGDQSFTEILAQVKETALGAYAHQDIPFEHLVEVLNPERSMNYTPLFQVMFALQSTQADEHVDIGDLSFSPLKSGSGVAKFDLTLTVRESASGLLGSVEYDSDLFEAETIRRFIEHYQRLLKAIVAEPEAKISEYEILSEAERHQQLIEWNDTQTDYPQDKCIHELFEEQAEQHPDNIALIFEDEELTYKALNERANQVAHYLIAQGVKPDTLVGLCVERSLEMVIGLIGILKAGGAYVPIDPDYPEERIRYMLEDSGVNILLSQSYLCERLPVSTQRVVYLDSDEDGEGQAGIISSQSSENIPKDRIALNSQHLAYVIYTSGSTGRPKGVMTEHKALLNRIDWMQGKYPLAHQDKVLQKTPFSFDVSVWELTWPFIAGAGLLIAKPQGHKDTNYLIHLIKQYKITVLHFVPSMLSQMVLNEGWRDCTSLTNIFCSGEALGVDLVSQHYLKNDASLHNLYGPTEAAIDVSAWHCPRQASPVSIPIGSPIQNIQLHVMSASQKIQAVGVVGEMYIGGAGLARGYLNNPELTAEKFIANPFSDDPDERLYRTGDLVRWLPDGNLEFIGRIDDQVKIRGFRIELGEIESQLQMHESVRSCVVVVREDIEGDKRLVAYVVIDSLSEVEDHVRVLREHLQQQLPEYMLPSAFVVLDELPLTSNGKIDRKSLPAPEGDAYAQEEYVAPETETEEVLVGIWSDLLGLEAGEISTRANFFALGGHSLLATRLVNLIFQRTGKELSLRSVFESPNVDKLAFLIDQLQTATEVLPLTRCNREQAIPLSFAQQRLWFLYKLEGANGFYNIPLALRISGEINTNALIQSIEAVVARHEALRTRFVEVDGVATQVIDGVDGFKVIQEEISEQALQSVCKSEASAPFDLSVDRLLRAHFFNVLESEDHVLLVTMHHIVSDGWSMEVFYREVVDFYQAFCQGASPSLAELPIQYADFAHWQRQWLGEEVLQIQRDYWQQQLSGLAPLLTFPTDHPRPPVKSYRGANEPVHFSVELLDQLKALGERQGVTLYMTLLSGFSVLLGRYTGQEDIPIGSPVANRNRPEVENLIGFFVNTLVMRTDLSGDQSFTEILAQVKETALGAYAHQDIPFEHLVEVLKLERSMNYTPLFQVMFALQSTQADEHVDIGDLSFSPLKSGSGVAKFDLTLTVRESASGLLGSVEYDSDLFEAETIRRFIEHYQRLLKAIVAEPEAKISEYEILSEAERHQQLIEWNDTQTDYPQGKCIHELFEEQAEQHPDNIALIFEDEELTYKALNERANQVAHYLIAQGVKPDTLVGLCVERSLEMVIGLIGILKAGGAYVPIDPDYPEERIRYMLEDSGVNILLSQSYLCERLPVSTQRVVYLDSDEDGEGQAGIISSQSSENIPKDRIALNSQHLAYVIYTSGSTGQPKGVLVEHHNAARLFYTTDAHFCFSQTDVWTLFHSFAFDFSVWEIWGSLGYGGRLVVVPQKVARSLEDYYRLLVKERVTVLNQTPSAFAGLIEVDGVEQANLSLRIVVLGGEALTLRTLKPWIERHGDESIRLVNMYGITETTVHVTYKRIYQEDIERGNGSVIGQRLGDLELYLLDDHLSPAPIGVIGEIYVGGRGVARGYLNNEELTKEKFIKSPFNTDDRLYKTGDLARFGESGELIYLGRIDDQVKIRGFRIELGEIESQLQMHESVRSCVVVVREDIEGDKRLVAYVVIDSLSEVEDHVRVLRKHLQQQLPEYMLPSAFVVLDELPLTSNGKIDRKSLPAPEGDAYAQEEYVAPETETEKVLVGIWSNLLGLEADKISTRANFFALGGHSLLMIRLVSAIENEMQRRISFQDLLANPNIAYCASAIENTDVGEIPQFENPVLLRAGHLQPLFLFHDSGGTLAPYLQLSCKLKTGAPIYAVQFDESQAHRPKITVEELAKHYIQLIRSIQAFGPYQLAGWSLGGLIAYEVAYQLMGEGQQVSFLGLIDTNMGYDSAENPYGENAHERELRVLSNYFKSRGVIMGEKLENELRCTRSREEVFLFCKSNELLPKEITQSRFSSLVQMGMLLIEAARMYEPPILLNNIHFYLASESSRTRNLLGWPSIIKEKWTIHEIEGNHHSIVENPNVSILGQLITNGLEEETIPLAEINHELMTVLQYGSSRAKEIFCFPGAGATPSCFLSLSAALGKSPTVYGMQARGLGADQVPHSTVSAAARDYISAILEVSPKGPYRLLGHSFGGWVAFEVACQLQALGKQVSEIILIDTISPHRKKNGVEYIERIDCMKKFIELHEQEVGEDFGLTKEFLSSLTYNEKVAVILDKMKTYNILPAQSETSVLKSVLRVFSAQLNSSYTPALYFHGKIALLLAKQDDNENEFDGWIDYSESIQSMFVDGNHISCLHRENVNLLAKLVSEIWEIE